MQVSNKSEFRVQLRLYIPRAPVGKGVLSVQGYAHIIDSYPAAIAGSRTIPHASPWPLISAKLSPAARSSLAVPVVRKRFEIDPISAALHRAGARMIETLAPTVQLDAPQPSQALQG